MTAIKILCDGTTRAALLTLTVTEGIDPGTIDCGALAETVKSVLNDHLSTILAEWKDATEASIGGAWLRELVNAQCNECGSKAVDIYLKETQ